MSKSQVCTRCVLPSSFPRITFDSQGVCSICREYDEWTTAWKEKLPEKRKILVGICAKVKSMNKEFDALIPYSGGKDSSYVLYVARRELGLNCLAYTLDNGYLSDHAKSNIERTCRKLAVEHVYYRLNSDLMNRLFALFIRKTGYPCSACMRAIGMGTSKLADLYNIPLIINGTSLRTELPFTREMTENGHLSHVRAVLKDEPILTECRRMLSGLGKRRKMGHLLFHMTGMKHPITHARIELSDYVEWNYDSIFNTIRRELDWTSPVETEHMDCIIHPIQKYIQTRRFPDLDQDRLRFARLIMAGQMTRDEALHRLKNHAEQCPESVLGLFLKNIGMSKDEFDQYIDLGPRHLEYNSPTWFERLTKVVFSSRGAGKY